MDIGLSGALDGIDAAEQIRSQYADLHIMFLTSYSNVKMKERAEHIHHSGYILKPFTSENLQKALAGVFN